MNPADKIPRPLAPELIEKSWSGREAWRVFEIIAEFADATERLKVAYRQTDVVKAIFDHYEQRGFEPSASARAAQLNL